MSNERLKVVVTQKDIDDGDPRNSISCPIARALDGNAKVLYTVCYFKGEAYELSTRAKQFIAAYDADRKVKPSTFYFRKM